MGKSKFPFKCNFSLEKLIQYWESVANESQDSFEHDFAAALVSKVKDIPELNGFIKDYSVLQKHESVVDALLTAVFPSAYLNTNLQAIISPAEFKAAYCTDRFKKLFCNDDGNFQTDMNFSNEDLNNGRIRAMYSGVLNFFYGVEMQISFPLIRRIVDDETGLIRFFKINLDKRFLDVKLIGKLPQLTKDQLSALAENIMDLELWDETLHPENFEINGFVVVNAFDVTEQESISAIKEDLLRKEVLATQEGFMEIEKKIRSMFRNPRLQLGLITIPDDKNRLLNAGHKVGNSFLVNESCLSCCKDYRGSIYEAALESDKPQIIYDLDNLKKCSRVDEAISKQGIKSLLVAGIIAGGKHIGMLELASPVPGDLNSMNAIKINEVLPLFSIALQRNIEDIENKVQAIIQEKCTSIHPSVEWRFREAAYNLLEKEKVEEYAEMEEIVFGNVYPIYALSDIRNSSEIRNSAIQSDLKHNLLLAHNIVKNALKRRNLPVLELLNYRIEEKILSIDTGLHSGDDAGIISFLKREIEPLFPMINGFGKNVADSITNYRNSLDPNTGIYYSRRKDYDESVALLNEEISAVVDREETHAQAMLPHYFEKYKTDGIEFTIYIGNSLIENGGFDELYLKNIRLWQLILMCKLARIAEKLKEKMKIKLELAHLILAQNTPLSVKFHYDQKRFDVDGTYNVHYEILKKRIDKAMLKGKEERLTQPGKLAIVYSQPSEAAEYRQYIGFLQSKGFLEEKIEDFELKDLQGVYGLRSLRAAINLNENKSPEDVAIPFTIKQMEKAAG